MLYDTIVGIATLRGTSAINVIRVSGDDAVTAVAAVFRGRDLTTVPSHNVIYGHIVERDAVIDEVLVSVFLTPKSFTAENVVEISTHGGYLIPEKIVSLLVSKGCRVAEPGEFTRRAYLNGRIDLSQAESVMDVIHAKTDAQLRLAHQGLDGSVAAFIASIQKEILEIVAAIEVNIDYPEYDDAIVMTDRIIHPKLREVSARIDEAIAKAATGKVIRDGVKAVIIGKPNVGKSSLLNTLLGEDKAIVTEISGTTRDLVEGELNLGDITLKLIDTAGIRETVDPVESIGIARSRKAMDEADLVLLVLDQSASLTETDRKLLELTKDKPRIVVGNKVDLGKNSDPVVGRMIDVSAKHKTGIRELEDEVHRLFVDERVVASGEVVIANARHIGKLKEAALALSDSMTACVARLPVDMIEIDIRRAWEALGEITGESGSDALIASLFSRFCLGK
ncbi:MAG TPA: tRNA uridine-5-carboxymethylaminomethyl(34) synthesis GTPase MnmE [Acholeplasmatales bacterium]|nr:tRNA uridine-5-carboxymethylaminomethyl(34) synthesis GTPase MnmE [Acholeplasmatales bacterium]